MKQNSTWEIQKLVEKINALPPTELNYYLILLLSTIHNDASLTEKQQVIQQIDGFVLALTHFYQEKTPDNLQKTTLALEALVNAAKTHTWTRTIQMILLKLCAAMTSFVLGVVGALIGAAAGLFLEWNVFKGVSAGFVVGGAIGLKIGAYLPEKSFRDPTVSKITYSLNHLKRVTRELETIHLKKPIAALNNPYVQHDYDFYQNETKRYIIETFFADAVDKEKAFQDFLNSKQSYQICASPAIFVNRKLDSTLGNHALIRYRINGITAIPIEYGARVKTPRWVNQVESTRHVSGQKLFEMLTLDRTLQETHSQTLEFKLFRFEMLNNDCHTYAQKVLLGTGQKPLMLKRFIKKTDTWTGYNIIRPLTEEFIQVHEDKEIQSMSSFYPGQVSSLSLFAKPKNYKTIQSVKDWEIKGTPIQSPLAVVCS